MNEAKRTFRFMKQKLIESNGESKSRIIEKEKENQN